MGVDIQDIKKIVSHRDSLILEDYVSSYSYEYIDSKGETRIFKTKAELQETLPPSKKHCLLIDVRKKDYGKTYSIYGKTYAVFMRDGKWKFGNFSTPLRENDTAESLLRRTPIEKDRRGEEAYDYTLQNPERCSGKILSILSQLKLSQEDKKSIWKNKVDILDFLKVYNRTHDVAKSITISSLITHSGKKFDEKTVTKALKIEEIWASNGNSEQKEIRKENLYKYFWMTEKVLNDETLMISKQTENGEIFMFVDADGTLVKQDDGGTWEAFVDRVKKQVLSGEESMLVKMYDREGKSSFKLLTNDTSLGKSTEDFTSQLDSATKQAFGALLERPVPNNTLKTLMGAKDISKTIQLLSERFTNPDAPLDHLSIKKKDGSRESVVVGSYDAMQQYMEACVAVGDAHNGLTLYKKLTNSGKRVNKENISYLLQTDSSFSRALPDAAQENLQLYLERPKASAGKKSQIINFSKKDKSKANTMSGGSDADESSNTTIDNGSTSGRSDVDESSNHTINNGSTREGSDADGSSNTTIDNGSTSGGSEADKSTNTTAHNRHMKRSIFVVRKLVDINEQASGSDLVNYDFVGAYYLVGGTNAQKTLFNNLTEQQKSSLYNYLDMDITDFFTLYTLLGDRGKAVEICNMLTQAKKKLTPENLVRVLEGAYPFSDMKVNSNTLFDPAHTENINALKDYLGALVYSKEKLAAFFVPYTYFGDKEKSVQAFGEIKDSRQKLLKFLEDDKRFLSIFNTLDTEDLDAFVHSISDTYMDDSSDVTNAKQKLCLLYTIVGDKDKSLELFNQLKVTGKAFTKENLVDVLNNDDKVLLHIAQTIDMNELKIMTKYLGNSIYKLDSKVQAFFVLYTFLGYRGKRSQNL